MLVSEEGSPLKTDALEPMETHAVGQGTVWSATTERWRLGFVAALTASTLILLVSWFVPGPVVQATGGLPANTQAPGRFSERELLEADPALQEAYVAGVLDALMLAYAEGEALAAAGLDPRNAYATLYEAVSHIPTALSASALKEEVVATLRESAGNRSAVFAVWRTLALGRCCWTRQAHLPD